MICPRCTKNLSKNQDRFQCSHCKTTFPTLSGVPFLMPYPNESIADWKMRFNLLQQSLLINAEECEKGGTPRLKKVAETFRSQADRLAECLGPLVTTKVIPRSWHVAAQTKLPENLELWSYGSNLFRDWVWGGDENAKSVEAIAKIVGSATVKRVLVLGAGGGRLAYDLHRHWKPESTIACDINPLTTLIAKRICAGETIELYEFPRVPINGDASAILQKLKAPERCEGIEFVIADALSSPFAPKSLDRVVTPWFVDIVPESFPSLCRRINGLVAEGGTWVQFGPLAFQDRNPGLAISIDEALEHVAAAGFKIERHGLETIPYLQSPHSCHGRVEKVLCFSARKLKDAEAPEKHANLPDWLTDVNVKVPYLEMISQAALATQASQVFLSKVNGEKSLSEMAKDISKERGIEEDAVRALLLAFFTQLHSKNQ